MPSPRPSRIPTSAIAACARRPSAIISPPWWERRRPVSPGPTACPGFFRSSSIVERGFCRDCGTPLSFAYDTSERIAVSIGSLDHPEAVTPAHQYGIESRLPAFAALHSLPGTRTEDDIPPDVLAKLKSRQHPDRE